LRACVSGVHTAQRKHIHIHTISHTLDTITYIHTFTLNTNIHTHTLIDLQTPDDGDLSSGADLSSPLYISICGAARYSWVVVGTLW